MLDRERRATERRIKAAKFPVNKNLETFDFLAIPSLWPDASGPVGGRTYWRWATARVGLALGLAVCQQGSRAVHDRGVAGA